MHHLNQNPWTSSKTQNSKLAASSIHSPSTHSILFFSTDQGQCEVGHFGLTALAPTQNISLGLWALDSWMLPTLQEEVMWWWGWGARKKSGLRELKTKPSMWLVVWTEAKARTEGRRRGRTEREEGGRGPSGGGHEDARSAGRLGADSQHVCVSILLYTCPCRCVFICPLRCTCVFWGKCIIAPMGMNACCPSMCHVWCFQNVMALDLVCRREQPVRGWFWITLFSRKFNYVIESMKSSITIFALHFIYRLSGQMDMERARRAASVTFGAPICLAFLFFF